MRFFQLLSFLVFFFFSSGAKAVNVDSLTAQCSKSGKIDVRAYDKLLGYFSKNNPEDLFSWSKGLLERALKNEDDFAEMLAYSYLADYYSEKGNHNLALNNFNRARQFYEAKGAGKELVDVLNGIGNVHFRKGEFKEAVKWYLKSMSKGEEMGDLWMMNMAKLNLGRCYLELKEPVKGEATILDFIEQVRRLNQPTSLANAYNVLGGYYQEKGDYDLADHYFNEALVISLNDGDKRNMAHSYNNLAISYFFQDKRELAKAYFRKALEQRRELGVKMYIAESYYNLGDWFFFENQLDSAIVYYQKSYEEGEAGNSFTAMGDALLAMAEVEKKRKRFERANQLLEEYLEVKQKQSQTESSEDLAVLEFDHKMTEERRMREARKQDELVQQRFSSFETRNKWLAISGISVLLITILVLIAKLWSEKKNYELSVQQVSNDFVALQDRYVQEMNAQRNQAKKVIDLLLHDFPDVSTDLGIILLGEESMIRTRQLALGNGEFFIWDAPLSALDSVLLAKQLLSSIKSPVEADQIDEVLECQSIVPVSKINWLWINTKSSELKAKSGFDSFSGGIRKATSSMELKSGLLVHQEFPMQQQELLSQLERKLIELSGFSNQMIQTLVADQFAREEVLDQFILVYLIKDFRAESKKDV